MPRYFDEPVRRKAKKQVGVALPKAKSQSRVVLAHARVTGGSHFVSWGVGLHGDTLHGKKFQTLTAAKAFAKKISKTGRYQFFET